MKWLFCIYSLLATASLCLRSNQSVPCCSSWKCLHLFHSKQWTCKQSLPQVRFMMLNWNWMLIKRHPDYNMQATRLVAVYDWMIMKERKHMNQQEKSKEVMVMLLWEDKDPIQCEVETCPDRFLCCLPTWSHKLSSCGNGWHTHIDIEKGLAALLGKSQHLGECTVIFTISPLITV
jgi:hypothetical protein